VCQKYKLVTDYNVVPRIASLFAGGIGNTGSVCGAVIGAEMAIALKQERARTMKKMLGNLAVAAEFRNRFEAELESINCRELTGADLSSDKGIREFMASDIPQKVCYPAVETAYRLAVELIEESAKPS
jgi:C_GCAxxG_C_C family probable redox protein